MVVIGTEDKRVEIPGSALEMTYGQQLDAKAALHKYIDASQGSNPELDGMLAMKELMLVFMSEEDFIELDFDLDSLRGVSVYLSKAVQNITETFEPKTELDKLVAGAIDYLKSYRPTFQQFVEKMAIEGEMDKEPFTNDLTISNFYTLTLKQAAIAIWPDQIAATKDQKDFHDFATKKGKELRSISADTMFHLRDAVLAFLQACPIKGPRSSSQSKAQILSPAEKATKPTTTDTGKVLQLTSESDQSTPAHGKQAVGKHGKK